MRKIKDMKNEMKEGNKEPQLSMPENKMGVMPIGKLLVSMSWPAMLSMLINALYNIVDSMFVAMVSESALTAVTLIFPIQMLMISVAVGTGVGVNSLIARRLGAHRFDEANAAASHGFRISFINWAAFAIFGVFFAAPYMRAYSETAYVVENGTIYLMITTIFSLFIFVQINTEKVLQATGNMVLPMLCSLSGAVINIVLDPILIFGLFGLPEMGVVGAAVATVIGQMFSMCLGLFLLFGRKHQVSIQLKHFRVNWRIVKDIYSVGLPSIVMQSIGSVMLFFINGILAAVSETAVAVVGAYFRLNSFIFMPVFGLNQGAMPIMGYNYGARNKTRLMHTFKLGLLIAAAIMVIGTVIFQVFPRQLLYLFSASDNMLELGVPALRIISISFIPAAFGILSSTIFQSTGHGMLSLWQSLIRQLVGIVPLAWVLVQIGGAPVVWWAWPLAEILGIAYCLIFLKRLYKKNLKNLDER